MYPPCCAFTPTNKQFLDKISKRLYDISGGGKGTGAFESVDAPVPAYSVIFEEMGGRDGISGCTGRGGGVGGVRAE